MVQLTILHTNDIHGRVGQLTRIATRARQIRSDIISAGGHCLFLDAGDSEDTTLLESSLTKGSAMEALLHAAGYEHAALGNAIPIRYGQQAIADLATYFGKPLLCANMRDEHGHLVTGLQAMAFETYDSLKVAIIGLTDPLDVYGTFFKLQMDDPAEIMPELIREAKKQGAKTIILLSHLGSKRDQKLAEQVHGIDVIIGAHDHKELYPPVQVNDTIIVQAGDFGRFIGRLDLTLDPDSGKILKYTGELLPITEEISPDPVTQHAMDLERERAQQLMSHQIGILEGKFELADEAECAAGNLLADALLDRVKGAQLSLVLTGHWQTGLEAGPLTQGTLFASIRSTANPAKAELTGEQILQFLRAALRPENSSRKLHSLRGRVVGMPHIAGACVRYSENLDEVEVEIDGQAMEPAQKYWVASTDMEFSDMVGYLVIPDNQVEYEVPTIMPEVLQDYITARTPLQPDKHRRVTPKTN